MRLYELKIQNNELSPIANLDNMIMGDTSYIKFSITTTDSAWMYATQRALLFTYDKKEIVVPIASGTADMPDEIAKQRYFKIRVIGLSNDVRLATNELLVEQEET